MVIAPLPASAQFLNVIESVFSGKARAIIHNSNYSSIDEAKTAMNGYFKDRNQHFQHYPKAAGKRFGAASWYVVDLMRGRIVKM